MTKTDPRSETGLRRIYLGLVDCTSTGPEAALELLDGAERERLSGFRLESRRAEFAAGRMLAKSMAARLLGLEAASISIELSPEGKPGFAQPEARGLSLGITHSAGVVLCAVSAAMLGLDIEAVSSSRDLAGIADYAFSESEREALAGARLSGGGERLFFVLWTLKESHLKRSGRGIAAIEKAPSFSCGEAGGLRAAARHGAAPRLDYLSLSLGDRFIASLAAEAAGGAGKAPLELSFDPRFPPPPRLEPRLLCSTCPVSPLSGL